MADYSTSCSTCDYTGGSRGHKPTCVNNNLLTAKIHLRRELKGIRRKVYSAMSDDVVLEASAKVNEELKFVRAVQRDLEEEWDFLRDQISNRGLGGRYLTQRDGDYI